MTMHSLLLLPFSANEGWPSLAERRPNYGLVFAFVVVPLSILASVMVYLAGTNHPELLPQSSRERDWLVVAYQFLLMQLLSVGIMGLVVTNTAHSYGFEIDYAGGYFLASIFPVPMWLSSLGLLVPNVAFMTMAALAGLGLSCGLVYHGLEGLARSREGGTAFMMTVLILVIGVGLWLAMLTIAFG